MINSNMREVINGAVRVPVCCAIYDAVNSTVYAEVCEVITRVVHKSLEFESDVEVCSKTKEEQNGKG